MDAYKKLVKEYKKRDRKRHGLQIAMALVVSFSRHFVETDRFLWDSFSDFFISVIIHYFGLLLFFVLPSFLVINKWGPFFLGDKAKEFSVDEAYIYIPLIIMTCAVSIFLIHLIGMASPGPDVYEP